MNPPVRPEPFCIQQKYCGIFTLRTGAYSAATLTILMAVIGIVHIAVAGSAIMEEEMEELTHESNAYREMVVNVALIITAILLAVWLLSGVILLAGIIKGSQPMMTFWIVVTVLFLSISLFGFINSVFCFDPAKPGSDFQNLMTTALELGYLSYMLLVVVSYKYSLKVNPPAYQPEWSHPQPEWTDPKNFLQPIDAKV